MTEILSDIAVRTVNIKTSGAVDQHEPILRINNHELIKVYNDTIEISPIDKATFTGTIDFTGATVIGFAEAVTAGTYDTTPLINMINLKSDIINPRYTGSVGINTSTPSEILDVIGNIKTSGTVVADGNISANQFIGDGSLLSNLPTTRWLSVSSNTDNVFINNNAFVGIGTTDPQYPLHFYNNLNTLTDINTRAPFFQNENTDRATDPDGTRAPIYLGQSDTNRNRSEIYFYYDTNGNNNNSLNFSFHSTPPRMTILAGGYVGIGSTSPISELDVNGDIRSNSVVIGDATVSPTFPVSLSANDTGISNTVDSMSFMAPSFYGHRFYTSRTTIPNPGIDDTGLLLSINNIQTDVYNNIVVQGSGTVTAGGTVLTFTGQHKNSSDSTVNKDHTGLIVSAVNNEYIKVNGVVRGNKAITIEESLPIVSLCKKEQDKACFGVVCSADGDSKDTDRKSIIGGFISVSEKERGDNRLVINSLGEGAMWVINKNGNLESGDYITSTNVPGYGGKQNTDSLKNYTVAKITMDCNFNPKIKPVKKLRKSLTPFISYTDGNITLNDEKYKSLTTEQQMNFRIKIMNEKTNEIDNNGDCIWEDTIEREYEYNIRYVLPDGTIISKDTYESMKSSGEEIYIAAFVGCTYHCG